MAVDLRHQVNASNDSTTDDACRRRWVVEAPTIWQKLIAPTIVGPADWMKIDLAPRIIGDCQRDRQPVSQDVVEPNCRQGRTNDLDLVEPDH
jgi:hypothetical protein